MVSADFPIDKPAGVPCPNLAADFSCDVHNRLRPLGFRGCSVFDCFGAGQQVTQHTLRGHDWRDPAQAPVVFAVFDAVRQLHELLWYLRQARTLVQATSGAGVLAARVDAARAAVTALVDRDADALVDLDVATHRAQVGRLLSAVSAHLRRPGLEPAGAELAGAELLGRDLRHRDLTRASLRGAYLIGCDLRGTVLDRTDLLGADLRDADLRGADLSSALFLTQMQVNAARGDATTGLPAELDRPTHWSG